MAYTIIDDPSAFFQTTLYTGTGSSLVVTNGGNSDLQPDLVWLKPRGITEGHFLTDSVRGVRQTIRSYRANAEETESQGLTAFSSDGFTMGTNSDINTDDEPGVAWQWKAGTSFTNDASSTSIGSIDSAGSASDASGFSIVSYTGTGSAGTIKHGLSSAPKMIIAKDRDSGSLSWFVGHASIGFTKRLKLDGTNNAADNTVWNNTSPTSSVFSVGSSANANTSGNAIIAYCFADIKGYSKMGSYIGNGNVDGTFVYTGFRPAFFMIKNITSDSTNWHIYDNKRLGYNVDNNMSRANLNNADQTDDDLDILSNGFKLRRVTSALSTSGDTYIYMCFAEAPFVTSTGVPATAR